ncbi:MAG: hypothetical protein IPL53_22800 [Ignavibacteria bacterium]|nr:hypothetical protein [Ignavibacteria bacterium]
METKTLYSQDRSEEIDIADFTQQMRALKTNVQLPDIILRLLYIRGIRDYQKVLKFSVRQLTNSMIRN